MGDDRATLREICENLDPEHQEQLGYDSSITDEKARLKTVLNTI